MDFSLCCCPGLDFRRFFRAKRTSAALRRRQNENGNHSSGNSERPEIIATENHAGDCGAAVDSRVQNSNHMQCDERGQKHIGAREETLNGQPEDETVKPFESDSGIYCNTLEERETRNGSTIAKSTETEILNQEIEETVSRRDDIHSETPETALHDPVTCTPLETDAGTVTQNGNIKKEMSKVAQDQSENDEPEVQSIDNLKLRPASATTTTHQERINYFIITCVVDACIIAVILYIYYSLCLD